MLLAVWECVCKHLSWKFRVLDRMRHLLSKVSPYSRPPCKLCLLWRAVEACLFACRRWVASPWCANVQLGGESRDLTLHASICVCWVRGCCVPYLPCKSEGKSDGTSLRQTVLVFVDLVGWPKPNTNLSLRQNPKHLGAIRKPLLVLSLSFVAGGGISGFVGGRGMGQCGRSDGWFHQEPRRASNAISWFWTGKLWWSN